MPGKQPRAINKCATCDSLPLPRALLLKFLLKINIRPTTSAHSPTSVKTLPRHALHALQTLQRSFAVVCVVTPDTSHGLYSPRHIRSNLRPPRAHFDRVTSPGQNEASQRSSTPMTPKNLPRCVHNGPSFSDYLKIPFRHHFDSSGFRAKKGLLRIHCERASGTAISAASYTPFWGLRGRAHGRLGSLVLLTNQLDHS